MNFFKKFLFIVQFFLTSSLLQAATADNAYVNVSSSTQGIEDIFPFLDNFYVTTRNAISPFFKADISIVPKNPYRLVSPEEGHVRLGIGDINVYMVTDESSYENSFFGLIEVLKLDIEPTETNVSWNSSSCTLKLTDDSSKNENPIWSSIPAGIGGSGNSITFNPSKLSPGEYTVTAMSSIVPSYKDKCIVRIVKIEFITPNGDPVSSPVDSGDGQNEFTFSSATPGVLTMNLKAKVTPTSAASKITNCYFTVGNIGSSVKNWAVDNPNGEAVSNGGNLTATVSFTGLPDNNSDFGKKSATVSWTGIVCDTKNYEVFFPKEATNHPGGQVGSPNWYYYWSQTSANKSNTTMVYSNGQPTNHPSRSAYEFYSKTIYILNDAALDGIRGWGYPQGIDCFAWITAHESKHHSQLTYFWSNQYESIRDLDRDFFVDTQEPIYMPGRPYSPTTKTTYMDTVGYDDNNPGSPILDIEDICMRSQILPYLVDILWNNGNADSEDWAMPGKQSWWTY